MTEPHVIPAKIGNCAHCGGECLLLNHGIYCLPCEYHAKPGKDGTILPQKTPGGETK